MVSGMMKKTMITLVLLGCAFLLPAQTKTTVQGRIENAENLRLYYYLNEESYPVSVDGDGRYNIELDLSDFTIIKFSPLTGYPSITLNKEGAHRPAPSMPVYIEPGEQVTVDFDLQKWPMAQIKGQKVAREWGKLYEAYGVWIHTAYENDRAKRDYNRKRDLSPEEQKQMDEEVAALRQKYNGQLQEFCATHPDSYISLEQVSQKVRKNPVEELMTDFNRLSRRIQESEPGQELLARITAKKNSSVGVAAPDFSGLTPEGKEVKLTDYRGKYVVIDFWGSWCHACRHSHPHMRELYEKYHSQGLEFIHIANEYQKKLEEKKEKWLAAIKEDQIGAFTHILNTADNDIVKVYNIQAFPTKILVSPTGEILGRWEGEASELDQMLEKIFLK